MEAFNYFQMGFNANIRYSSASLSSGNFMLVINSVSRSLQRVLSACLLVFTIECRSQNFFKRAACGAANAEKALQMLTTASRACS